MGFWKKLFGRKKKTLEIESNWDQLEYSKEGVDFHNDKERTRFIADCLEQSTEASSQITLLTKEYSEVTDYLCDMEEIEALPKSESERVKELAEDILNLEEQKRQYTDDRERMSDNDYYTMRMHEDEVQEGIQKLRECEEYAGKVKQDLSRLKSERYAYEYRKKELEESMENCRGVIGIVLTAMVVCVLLLAVLHFAFHKNVFWGFFVAALAGAFAMAGVFLKHLEQKREYAKVRSDINRLIQLQNKVKIKYVNNTNLLEYLLLKYDTKSVKELEKKWTLYQKEKEDRRQFMELSTKLEKSQNQLLGKLSTYRLKEPSRWLVQLEALLDKREMVEIRHDLIVRRQALRKQLEYNRSIADAANKQIMDVAREYPQYMQEIQDMVKKCSSAKAIFTEENALMAGE